MTDSNEQPDVSETETPSEATATVSKRKKMGWADPFETHIFQLVLKPHLSAILNEGVRNRTHLCQIWAERFGTEVGQDRMQRWLEMMGLGTLFGNKPLIRVPLVPQAPAAPIAPQAVLDLPPEAELDKMDDAEFAKALAAPTPSQVGNRVPPRVQPSPLNIPGVSVLHSNVANDPIPRYSITN